MKIIFLMPVRFRPYAVCPRPLRGVSTVEYAILAAGIALAVSVAAGSGGFSLENLYLQLKNFINAIDLSGGAGAGSGK